MSDHDAPPADPDELDFTDDENVVEIGESRYVVGTNGRPNVGRSQPDRAAEDDSAFRPADPENPDARRPPGGGQAESAVGGGGQRRSDAARQDRRGGGGQAAGGRGGQSAGGQTAPARTPDGHATGGTQHGGGAPVVDRQAVSRWLASSFDNDGFTYGIDATLHVNGETTRQRMVSNDVTATFDTLVSWFASNAGPSSPTPEALGLLLVAAETTVDVPPVAIKRFATSQGLTASDTIGDLVRAAEENGGFRIE
ncbi:DUF7500 family protein [Halorubrum pallidum]